MLFELLPIIFAHASVTNLKSLSAVNHQFRQASKTWISDYVHSHKLRYFGKGNKRKTIRVIIRGQIWMDMPKAGSIWTIEIWKEECKGKITMTASKESLTLDLTACKSSSAERTYANRHFVHPDPWIVQPLIFTPMGRTLALQDNAIRSWLFATLSPRSWRQSVKPPRFFRVACGYLDMYFYFASCTSAQGPYWDTFGHVNANGFWRSLPFSLK